MQTRITILIIEDEPSITNFIETTLTANNYKTLLAYTGKEALSMLTSHCPDLVLLDLGLPDMDGMEILTKLRSWSKIPVIVVSARTNEHDKVAALDNGADDYIIKPFGTSELLARIRTALRHSHLMATQNDAIDENYHYEDLEIDFKQMTVSLSGQEIHLTQIEFKLLSLLAKNAGRVLTYDYLIQEIWGPFDNTSNNQKLRVNMANIRRKIEKNPADPHYIFTQVGVGYKIKSTV